jgi:endonuclease/exonuclease/phosphatase family metal-dependent hydrolase
MSKPAKIFLRATGILLGTLLIILSGFLLLATLTEYSPAPVAKAEANSKGIRLNPAKRSFTFLTWNIGYAGLGREMDFFYDGGKTVKPPRAGFEKTLAEIKKIIAGLDTIDFVFIQELDRDSKRSYHTDILAELSAVLPNDYCAFGKNYDCFFVPLPLFEPMGRVKAGLASFSPYHPDSSEVVSLNTRFSWPTRTMMLKRCFVAMKYKLEGGKELVVINTHNSAYDAGGEVRKNELTALGSYMTREYHKGNWVIAGGDWNDNPRGFDPSLVFSHDPVYKIKPPIDESFLPGWEFISDPWLTSNRNVDMPYRRGVTRTTTMDFFVISPNVKFKKVRTLPMEFEFSDHNPVMLEVELKEIAR